MKNLKGTKTLENLMKSFAGESQARNRYTFFASQARKDGYRQIEAIFTETAGNEKEHAQRFYELMLAGLGGEAPTEVEINASYPVSSGSTLENLEAAAAGERDEWTNLYKNFGIIAETEGFHEIAAAYKNIASVEEKHEARYNKLADNVRRGLVFKRGQVTKWKCGNCGFVFEGAAAPDVCPACLHPKEYYELYVEAY